MLPAGVYGGGFGQGASGFGPVGVGYGSVMPSSRSSAGWYGDYSSSAWAGPGLGSSGYGYNGLMPGVAGPGPGSYGGPRDGGYVNSVPEAYDFYHQPGHVGHTGDSPS